MNKPLSPRLLFLLAALSASAFGFLLDGIEAAGAFWLGFALLLPFFLYLFGVWDLMRPGGRRPGREVAGLLLGTPVLALVLGLRLPAHVREMQWRARSCASLQAAEAERIERDRPQDAYDAALLKACADSLYRLNLREGPDPEPLLSDLRLVRDLGGWE